MTSNIKYNIVENDGEQSSATVFLGGMPLVATKDHPNFRMIVTSLSEGKRPAETDDLYASRVRGLFDVGVAIITGFAPLSERVSVAHGKLYLDHDVMPGSLSDAIVRFHAEGNSDFKPLVCFLEKLATNPSQHSRENLYRWMEGKRFGICPDGDFIAYKGLDGVEMSIHSGGAIVNGQVVKGKVPNKRGTVIEMARSKVTFDSHVGCAAGLHVGNYSYAQGFAQGKVVIVKVNPRDVVSVPTDCSDQKMRVCRYYVMQETKQEDLKALFVPEHYKLAKFVPEKAATSAPPKSRGARKKAPAKAVPFAPVKKAAPVKKELVFPEYVDDFKREHFEGETLQNLRFYAREFAITPQPKDKAGLVDALVKATVAARRKTSRSKK